MIVHIDKTQKSEIHASRGQIFRFRYSTDACPYSRDFKIIISEDKSEKGYLKTLTIDSENTSIDQNGCITSQIDISDIPHHWKYFYIELFGFDSGYRHQEQLVRINNSAYSASN